MKPSVQAWQKVRQKTFEYKLLAGSFVQRWQKVRQKIPNLKFFWSEHRNNLYLVLVLRLLAVMVLFSICRVGFYLFNKALFPELTYGQAGLIMLGGLRFDLTAVLYVNFVYLHLSLLPGRFRHQPKYQTGLNIVFVVTNGLALAANCFDFAYYPYVLRRSTWSVFSEFKNETQIVNLLPKLLSEDWKVLAFWLGLMLPLILVANYCRVSRLAWPQKPKIFYLVSSLAWLFASTLIVFGIRSGFFSVSHRPIAVGNAAAYVERPEHVALVLNTPFSLIRTVDKKPLEERHDFAEPEELEAIYSPIINFPKKTVSPRPNVVIIILESFGANGIGHLAGHLDNGTFTGYTPFLDSLTDKCLTFTNAFGGGIHSIDALPTILAGIPAHQQAYVLSHYAQNKIRGLGTLLSGLGYQSGFFHGAPNGSMGFDAFVKLAGIKRYFGMNEFNNPDAYDGGWGIWDEEFFEWTAQKLDNFTPPFLGVLYSITSHSPFRVPPRYAGKFKKGTNKTYEVMGYTDYALKRFFEAATQKSWFKDTLFVITADHDRPATHSEFRNVFGRIPLLICKFDDLTLRGKNSQPASQADIMPTVLGYAGFSGSALAFGQNLLNAQAQRMAVIWHPWGTFQLALGDYLLRTDGQKPRGLFKYPQDRVLKNNLLSQDPHRAEEMNKLLLAIIQQYNNRMRRDLLVAENPK